MAETNPTDLPPVTPEPGTPCRYSARHQAEGVPAVELLDMSPVGIIPCCAACAAFYRRMQ